MMRDGCGFLSYDEEDQIKIEYERQKDLGNIDNDLIPLLDNFNSIDGLATLYSCQGHLINPQSYLVLKFNEQMLFPISESIWEIMSEFDKVKVDWDFDLIYTVDKETINHRTTMISGNMDYSYMNILINKINSI